MTDEDQKCNAAGIALIRIREGLSLEAYKDSGGVWTIGWGHTGPEVAAGLVWPQSKADAELLADIAQRAEKPVNALVKYELTSNQFSALCSFVYDIGWGNFERSSALAFLNHGDFDAVPDHMALWNKDHAGHVLNGLTTRRAAEAELFNTPDPDDGEDIDSA